MSALIGRELRRARKEIERLHRKLALARMPGQVAEVRKQDGRWQVKLELGEDPATCKKVLGPWTRVATIAAGDTRVAIKPVVGQRMYQVSASGVVGADSVAEFAGFDDEVNQPDGDDDVTITRGDARFDMTGERVRGRVGDARFVASGAAAKIRKGGDYVVVTAGKVIVSRPPVVAPDPDPN
jgi:hypothetical protein